MRSFSGKLLFSIESFVQANLILVQPFALYNFLRKCRKWSKYASIMRFATRSIELNRREYGLE
jgi:hypothetical protein